MSNTVTCDVCFESEDIDDYDVDDRQKIKYIQCPPDWMVSLNGRIEIMSKHDFLGRNVRIKHICFGCLKEAVTDLLAKTDRERKMITQQQQQQPE